MIVVADASVLVANSYGGGDANSYRDPTCGWWWRNTSGMKPPMHETNVWRRLFATATCLRHKPMAS